MCRFTSGEIEKRRSILEGRACNFGGQEAGDRARKEVRISGTSRLRKLRGSVGLWARGYGVQ